MVEGGKDLSLHLSSEIQWAWDPKGGGRATRQDGAGLPSEHFDILVLIQSPGQPGEVFRAKMKIPFYNGGNEVHCSDGL